MNTAVPMTVATPAPTSSSPPRGGHASSPAKPVLPRADWGAAAGVLLCLALTACGNKPPVPGWQMDARDSSERAAQAWLVGDGRVEAAEFARAQSAVASTGRADLLARLALMRCATRVAALDFTPCSAFDALAVDAAPAEQAYARYLAGQALATDRPLLPPAQQPWAAATAVNEAALAAMEDPLSRLVAAGVLFRRGLATPGVLDVAVDTASTQGWRRPLLAWLGVQRERALAAGAAEAAMRLQRRIDLVERGGR